MENKVMLSQIISLYPINYIDANIVNIVTNNVNVAER